jgi:hypothetical protein
LRVRPARLDGAAVHPDLATARHVRKHGRPRLPICWYGRQDAPWIAHHDVNRPARVGPVELPAAGAATVAHRDGWSVS